MKWEICAAVLECVWLSEWSMATGVNMMQWSGTMPQAVTVMYYTVTVISDLCHSTVRQY